jgi:hypothetical protein
MHVFIKIHRILASQSKNFSLVVTSGWQPSPRVYFFANLGVIKMNGNNIYSGNQHHKKCFSDGCCKTLIYIVCVHIYSVRAVFTYWYIYGYIWYTRKIMRLYIGYMMLYIFTRIQRVSKLYFKYTVCMHEYYKDRDLRSSFLRVPNCSMDLVL